jgi:hypothetical protein
MYVGKHGSDSNDGKSPENAKLTIGAALTACSPRSSSSRWRVEVIDGGIYNEDVVHKQYTVINAPAATLQGYLDVAQDGGCRFYKIAPDNATNNSAIYYNDSNGEAWVEVELVEAYSSAASRCVRTEAGGSAKLSVKIGTARNTRTDSTSYVFFNDFQGALVVECDYVDTNCRLLYSDNTLGDTSLEIGEVYVNSSYPLGTRLMDWAHPTFVDIGVLNLNNRGYVFESGPTYPIGGTIGSIEGLSSSYPLDVRSARIQMTNVKRIQVNLHDGDASSTLGASKYFSSNGTSVFAYGNFTIPPEALAYEIYANYITSAGDTSMSLSLFFNDTATTEIYTTHTPTANTNYNTGGGGNIDANDWVRHEITGYFANLSAGDAVGMAIGRGSSTSGTYYFGSLEVIYWQNGQ